MNDTIEQLIFWLPWPPTINSYWKPIRGGIYLSSKGRKYRQMVEESMREQMPGVSIDERVMVEVTLFPPDAKTRDVDNYNKGVLDALTHCEFWSDDSLVDQLFVYRGEVTKGGIVRVEVNAAGPIITLKMARKM